MAVGGVNCPFYFKIGACPHGNRCSWLHNPPTISPTIVLFNMYQRSDMTLQEQFEDFYEDIFEELSRFGKILNLNVCDNICKHLIGNIYVHFKEEREAAEALNAFQGALYFDRAIIADFSPVTDFREAICRRYMFEDKCERGGYCNFLHVKVIGRGLRKKLFGKRSLSPRLAPVYSHKSKNKLDDEFRHENGRRTHQRRRSPIRERSVERRAKIEMWNLEREARSLGPG